MQAKNSKDETSNIFIGAGSSFIFIISLDKAKHQILFEKQYNTEYLKSNSYQTYQLGIFLIYKY